MGTRQNLNGRLSQIVDELVHQGVTLEQARQEFERQFIVASLRSNEDMAFTTRSGERHQVPRDLVIGQWRLR